MRTLSRLLSALTLSLALVPVAQAGVSSADALRACKTEAQARHGHGQDAVRVKLKGMHGNSRSLKLRLEVVPATGERFMAICVLDHSGRVVSLQPASAHSGDLAANRR